MEQDRQTNKVQNCMCKYDFNKGETYVNYASPTCKNFVPFDGHRNCMGCAACQLWPIQKITNPKMIYNNVFQVEGTNHLYESDDEEMHRITPRPASHKIKEPSQRTEYMKEIVPLNTAKEKALKYRHLGTRLPRSPSRSEAIENARKRTEDWVISINRYNEMKDVLRQRPVDSLTAEEEIPNHKVNQDFGKLPVSPNLPFGTEVGYRVVQQPLVEVRSRRGSRVFYGDVPKIY